MIAKLIHKLHESVIWERNIGLAVEGPRRVEGKGDREGKERKKGRA